MKRCISLFILALLVSCEKAIIDESASSKKQGNVTLTFIPQAETRATDTKGPKDYFSKLHVMLFDSYLQNKLWDKVKTQNSSDENFGTINFNAASGLYAILAVGHSSIKSASINSAQQVTFTAYNGEKLTDTFYTLFPIGVNEEGETERSIMMSRNVAMFRLVLKDEKIPEEVDKFLFEYTGGSANFNPSTGFGCTKSSQSEARKVNENNIYEVYTFPYANEDGQLKMDISAIDASGTILMKKTLDAVYVRINQITQYEGVFFTEEYDSLKPVTVGITINGEWDGTITYTF